MKNSFSTRLIEFLKDHDYIFKDFRNGCGIRKSNGDTLVIIGVVVLICIPITIFMFEQNKMFVAAMWIFVSAGARFLLKSVQTHFILKIEQPNRVLRNGHNEIAIKDIKSVDFNSKYIAKYTSAFKDTSEEHKISLIISMKGGQKHTIFNFKSDYANPSSEMNQLRDFISKEINKAKVYFERDTLQSIR